MDHDLFKLIIAKIPALQTDNSTDGSMDDSQFPLPPCPNHADTINYK